MSAVTAQTVINKAKSFVGVKESPANSNNVIFNTHYYGKAVSGSAYPWCAVFLWDVFRLCNASDLFCGGAKCAYTPTIANYYKQIGRWHTGSGKPGDLVLYQFAGSNRINHIGILVKDNGTTITTIEGNTSSSNDANGGAVEIRTRPKTYVKGFARPAYKAATSSSTVSAKSSDSSAYTKAKFIKEVQKALGLPVTGKTTGLLNKTITVSEKKNSKHAVVKPIQRRLNALGYKVGNADGEAGPKFTAGLKKYQAKFLKKPDGVITAKSTTWKKLLGIS